ncbi:copper resistance D family protein [Loktanella sp. M215]|uniref:copper resistance D family protein n=1 Tax=Loktanella sp. M215 TaxID=2675431 RepID=UPI001F00682B|nr:copper transporter [Loktanella sp. M215]
MEGAADIDGLAIAAILAKAAGYAAALLAMGGPLFVTGFRQPPKDVSRLARQIAVAAALVGLAVLALRFGIRAARISGMGLSGAVDPLMLGFVWDSPLGTAAIWRGAGYACILALLLRHPAGKGLSLIGTLLIAVSYTRVGHALSDPQVVLSACLVAHLLALALWIAALIPLRRSAGLPGAAALLHDFGRVASVTVPLLIVVGLVFAWVMVGSVSALVGTAYGLTLLIKVALVSVLLSLAALNKWRLVPALAQDLPHAIAALRRAITLEMAVVGLILLATATLTSVTTPPLHL